MVSHANFLVLMVFSPTIGLNLPNRMLCCQIILLIRLALYFQILCNRFINTCPKIFRLAGQFYLNFANEPPVLVKIFQKIKSGQFGCLKSESLV